MSDILSILFASVWTLVLSVVFFGGSVFVHELGHFLAARWRGLVIESFFVGIPPRIWSTKRNGIEYGIGLLPLGGFVRLPQLAEMGEIEGESERKAAELPPLTWTDKVIVAAAGAFFNVLFALALGAALWVVKIPEAAAQKSTTVGYIAATMKDAAGKEVPSPAIAAGLRLGDRIVSIDDRPVEDFRDLVESIVFGDRRDADGRPVADFVVEREGVRMELRLHPLISRIGTDTVRKAGIAPAYPLLVEGAYANSPAERVGLKKGDLLQSANGQHLYSWSQFDDLLEKNQGRTLRLAYRRDGRDAEVDVTPFNARFTEKGRRLWDLGTQRGMPVEEVRVNPFTQVRLSLVTTLRVLKALVSPKSDVGLDKLSSPLGIAMAIHDVARYDLRNVLSLILLINVNLAIMNLLPIPVLDGGHILFATLAKLRGRPLPARIVERVQFVFVIALLSLMAYAVVNDLFRLGDRGKDPGDRLLPAPDFTGAPAAAAPSPGTPAS